VAGSGEVQGRLEQLDQTISDYLDSVDIPAELRR